MGIYQKALIPFDGSESSKNALKQACLMEGIKALHILSVFPVYEGDLELIGIDKIKQTIEGPVKELIEQAASIAQNYGVDALTEVRYGEPYKEIVSYAEELNCDIIIMGRKGISQVERQLIGSVTARVVGHSKKDVLVIPQKAELEFKKILVAMDESEFSQRALARAIELSKEYGSALEMVYVVFTYGKFFALAPEATNEIKAKAKEFVKSIEEVATNQGVKLVTNIVEGEAHIGIIKTAEQKDADLIVMGSHGRSGISKLILGSVTEKVMGMVSCPVLAVH